MKILLIGQPRSRSNYLLEILAHHYQVENLKEPYTGLTESWQFYYNAKKISQNLKTKDDFIIKIQTVNINGIIEENHDRDLYKFIFFEDYDKIFITLRHNLVNQVASLISAHETKNFAKQDINFERIMYDPIRHEFMLMELYFDILRIKYLEYRLTKNKKNYVKIFYETCEEWLDNNIGYNLGFDKNHNQYDKIITNYDQLVIDVQKYFGSTIYW